VTSEGHLSQGDWRYASGTIALQFVTAVTSDTVTLSISIKIAPRAGPKPAAPVIRNVDCSLKKILHTNMSYKAEERSSAVWYMYVEK